MRKLLRIEIRIADDGFLKAYRGDRLLATLSPCFSQVEGADSLFSEFVGGLVKKVVELHGGTSVTYRVRNPAEDN